MDINFQRKIDRFVGVPVCALLSLVERLRRRRPAADPPKRILVLLLSEMGSLVLARPMFSYLKRRYPNASIHVMVFEKNREVLDLLAAVPETDVLTLNDRSIGAFASDSLGILRRMRFGGAATGRLRRRRSTIENRAQTGTPTKRSIFR